MGCLFSDWDDKDQSVQDGILQAGGQNSEDRRYTLYLKDIACLESLVNLISLLYKEI